jgi:hypothetical protein
MIMVSAVNETPIYLSWTFNRILAKKLHIVNVNAVKQKYSNSYISSSLTRLIGLTLLDCFIFLACVIYFKVGNRVSLYKNIVLPIRW